MRSTRSGPRAGSDPRRELDARSTERASQRIEQRAALTGFPIVVAVVVEAR